MSQRRQETLPLRHPLCRSETPSVSSITKFSVIIAKIKATIDLAADNDVKLLVSVSVVLHKALRTTGKTVSFTEIETFHTMTTCTKVMTPQVLDQVSPPQNHRKSVLGKRGITTPHAQSKLVGDCA